MASIESHVTFTFLSWMNSTYWRILAAIFHGGLRCPPMFRDTRPQFHLHGPLRERFIGSLARPDICLPWPKMRHPLWCESPQPAFAFWICFSQAGELNLWRMI